MTDSRKLEMIVRRGELLAELFLNDLGAKVTQSPFEAADYLAFFELDNKAFQVMAVEVKAIETPLPKEFPVSAALLRQAAQFNIPTLLLVVDVKQNQVGFAWLDECARTHVLPRQATRIRIPLVDGETYREQIREHVLATTAAPNAHVGQG